ncbi:L,D-transpeptidase [Gammaproteobacteria bacterium]
MNRRLLVEVSIQELIVWESGHSVCRYPVSTGRQGVGEIMGSERTPRGLHRIRLKIGENCPINTVFLSRRPTGERYHPDLAARHPERDWILTRILWLSGLESGFNRGISREGHPVDTLRRFIYIHGTPDETPLGTPGSRGCIRMHNEDLLALFNRVRTGDLVEIVG